VIIGARSLGQLEDNLTAVAIELTAEDRDELDAASQIPWGYPYDYIGRHEPW
jgi:aryl-alcohol dehydrogenase-like predicted oxidoreductase